MTFFDVHWFTYSQRFLNYNVLTLMKVIRDTRRLHSIFTVLFDNVM